MVRRKLLSKKYANDGISLMPLNDIQQEYRDRFIKDDRIRYKDIEKCPACNYDDLILIAEKDRYGIPLETVVCNRCSLIFSHNQMTEESTALFYSEYYRKLYEGLANPTVEHYRKSYDPTIKNIPKFLQKDSTVVEIGTGGGWNLLRFKMYGLRHYGFDYDEKLIRFGRDHFGLNLHVGSVDKAKSLGVQADYTILSHVLEHVSDPVAFLTGIKDILKDDSIVKVTVPSIRLLFISGPDDLLGTFQNAHNFLFDEFTIKYVALKAGYNCSASLWEYAMLRKDKNSLNLLGKIDAALDRNFRGPKVIKYLEFCEKLAPLKMNIIPANFNVKLRYLYFLSKPRELFKLYLILNKKNVFAWLDYLT